MFIIAVKKELLILLMDLAQMQRRRVEEQEVYKTNFLTEHLKA